MQQLAKILSDIFSMGFDIIIPLSGCIVAFVVATVLFTIRYASYKRNKRKFERRGEKGQSAADAGAANAALNEAPAESVATELLAAAAARQQDGLHVSSYPELDRLFSEEMDAALGRAQSKAAPEQTKKEAP